MSKTLFSFILSELKTIRVRCKLEKCNGTILEIPIAKIGDFYEEGSFKCPICKQILFDGENQRSWVRMLGEAIAGINQNSKHVEVEFSLPDGSDAKS